MTEIASMQDAPAGASERTISRAAALKGLLWCEWLRYGRMLVGFAAVWIVLLWVLELLFHPIPLLVFGAAYVLLAGPIIGGADAAEGAEEFAFALPPTRADRYLVRLAVGLGPLLIFQGVGAAAIAGDWPQAVWGLFVESGLADPFEAAPGVAYAAAFSAPVAAFSATFVVASCLTHRWMVMMAWIPGSLAAAGLFGFAAGLEHAVWDRPTGLIVGPVLPAAAALILLGGHLAYQRKEGVARAAGAGMSWAVRGLIVALAALVALGVLGLLWAAEGDRADSLERSRLEALEVRSAAAPLQRIAPIAAPTRAATSTASAPASRPAGMKE